MSALCIGPCRPAEFGGPRAAGVGGHLCDVCADRFAEHLREIAGWWPDLLDRLGHESGDAMSEKVKGTRPIGLVLNETVSDGMADVTSWLMFVARLVIDERDVRAPTILSVPSLATWLADWHAPWLTAHPDAALVQALADEAAEHAKKCQRLAAPSGARKLELPLPCVEYVQLTVDSDRIPCPGTMHAWVAPDSTRLPDLVCSEDKNHRVDPATWSRPTFRKRFDRDAAHRLAAAILDQRTGT